MYAHAHYVKLGIISMERSARPAAPVNVLHVLEIFVLHARLAFFISPLACVYLPPLLIALRVSQTNQPFVQPVIMAITLALMKCAINVRQIAKCVVIGLHALNVLPTTTC